MAAAALFGPLFDLLLSGGDDGEQGTASGSVRRSSDERSGTSATSTRRVVTPEQQRLFGMLLDEVVRRLRPAEPKAERAAGAAAINKRYGSVPQNLANKLLAFGGSRSGKFGRAVREAEVARAGELGELERSLWKAAEASRDAGVGLAERLLGLDFGTDTRSATRERGSANERTAGASGRLSDRELERVLAQFVDEVTAPAGLAAEEDEFEVRPNILGVSEDGVRYELGEPGYESDEFEEPVKPFEGYRLTAGDPAGKQLLAVLRRMGVGPGQSRLFARDVEDGREAARRLRLPKRGYDAERREVERRMRVKPHTYRGAAA